jgi:hypothetical protein
MSKFLVHLVDEAVFPAALVIAAKALGVILVNLSYGYTWSVDTVFRAFWQPHLIYVSKEAALNVASYSNLIMFIAVFAGMASVIIKAFYLHESHASPQMVLKLAKMDLLHMLQSSFALYHQAIVWFGFQLLTTLFILTNYLQGMTYGWIAVVICTITLVTFWMLAKDIDHEVERKVLAH